MIDKMRNDQLFNVNLKYNDIILRTYVDFKHHTLNSLKQAYTNYFSSFTSVINNDKFKQNIEELE